MSAQAQTTTRLDSPRVVRNQLSLNNESEEVVLAGRALMQRAISGQEDGLLVMVGQQAANDMVSVREFSKVLQRLGATYELQCVPMVFYPQLDVYASRRFLLEAIKAGLGVCAEVSNAFIHSYVDDLLSIALLRDHAYLEDEDGDAPNSGLASGISAPFGLESTRRELKSAIRAVNESGLASTFYGINGDGRSALLNTGGNNHGFIMVSDAANPITVRRASAFLSGLKIPHMAKIQVGDSEQDLTSLEMLLRTSVSMWRESKNMFGVYLYCASETDLLDYLFRYLHEELAK
ncbi:hypothetical protein CL632_02400 [bacterium]|jgi:3-deoxy-D-arabino-heptulosonate 7-phosphate (DAHP) synthase|nr:hypothetical protein [bacterium]|tara:strand:- start:8717 stop:9589 length:873 start_codon:yes stop_codon:yes gene_type:complete